MTKKGMLLAGGDHPLLDLVEYMYSAMKLMIGIGVFFFSLFPVSSTTIMFLSNLGTGVVVQVGNGHLAFGTLK